MGREGKGRDRDEKQLSAKQSSVKLLINTVNLCNCLHLSFCVGLTWTVGTSVKALMKSSSSINAALSLDTGKTKQSLCECV